MAGTSAGARKGWETRRRKAARESAPSRARRRATTIENLLAERTRLVALARDRSAPASVRQQRREALRRLEARIIEETKPPKRARKKRTP